MHINNTQPLFSVFKCEKYIRYYDQEHWRFWVLRGEEKLSNVHINAQECHYRKEIAKLTNTVCFYIYDPTANVLANVLINSVLTICSH